jgi:hypothetical protein
MSSSLTLIELHLLVDSLSFVLQLATTIGHVQHCFAIDLLLASVQQLMHRSAPQMEKLRDVTLFNRIELRYNLVVKATCFFHWATLWWACYYL